MIVVFNFLFVCFKHKMEVILKQILVQPHSLGLPASALDGNEVNGTNKQLPKEAQLKQQSQIHVSLNKQKFTYFSIVKIA